MWYWLLERVQTWRKTHVLKDPNIQRSRQIRLIGLWSERCPSYFFRKLNWRMLGLSRNIPWTPEKYPFFRSYQIAYCPDLHPSVIKGSCEFFQLVGFICCRLSGITLYKYPQSLVVLSADGMHPAASRPAFSPTGFTVKAPGWCFGAARPVKNKRVRGRHLLMEYKRTKRSAMAIKYKSEHEWMNGSIFCPSHRNRSNILKESICTSCDLLL